MYWSKISAFLLIFVLDICVSAPQKDVVVKHLEKISNSPKGTNRTEWCDPVLGCLITDDSWDFPLRPINVSPDTREKINTRFYLHTRAEPNPNSNHILSADDTSTITNSPYDATKCTQLIVHGFIDTGNTQWLLDLAQDLLIYEDCNVIRVDWGDGSLPMYSQATANTRVVGLEIGHLLNTLIEQFGLDPTNIHCMGHSLGAHTCGYGGEQVLGTGRITGLDPAGPYFTGTADFVHLDPTDAIFVDCIHTDADSILLLGYGTGQPMGNIDFFPNSGHEQPGCDAVTIAVDQITDQDLSETGRNMVACSHIRAIKYFAESVQSSSCTWLGHECYDYNSFEKGSCYSCNDDNTKCAYLGIRADEYVAKSRLYAPFYLDTTKDEPFCENHYEVRILTAYPEEAESWVMGRLKLTLYGDNGNIIQEVQITEDHERIDHGQIKTNLIKNTIDVSHILRIELQWTYDNNVLNPGTYCVNLVCNRSLYVQSVQVSSINHYPESERLSYTTLGCSLDGTTTEIEDGKTESFMPSPVCTSVKDSNN